ncbi:MAG: cupin domain-containing protein [Patescibacteria group bacterium]
MKITHPGFSKAAIIDTTKKYGDKGQYRLLSSSKKNLKTALKDAKKNQHEVRYDYDMMKAGGKKLPFRFIITDIPPGHIQPFHSHKNLHELTIVLGGEILYIESDKLSESKSARKEMKKIGVKLSVGDLVIDDKIKRHTVANYSKSYARMITIQSAKKEGANLVTDWIHS